MNKLTLLVVILVSMMISSCEHKITVENIKALESQSFSEYGMLNPEYGTQLIDAYVLYAKQNPDAVQSPDYLFRAIDISVNLNAKEAQKTIDIANDLIEKYPDFELSPMAMYIKGFVYENQLNDIEKALDTYHQFLEKYPNSHLINEVKSTIENIGLSPEELIRKFEGN